MKPKVLFLCTGNSCRSQMAEGWAKYLYKDKIEAYSAGTAPQKLNPLAVQVMSEVGIDISDHKPKSLESLSRTKFDLVVTVCDNAANTCPTPPESTRVVHAPFDDPPALAKNCSAEAETLRQYRRVRDEIREFIQTLKY